MSVREVRRWEYLLADKKPEEDPDEGDSQEDEGSHLRLGRMVKTQRLMFLEVSGESFSYGYSERSKEFDRGFQPHDVTRELCRNICYFGKDGHLREHVHLPCLDRDRETFHRIISSISRMIGVSNEVHSIFWMMTKHALSDKEGWMRKWAPDHVSWMSEHLRAVRKQEQERRRTEKEKIVLSVLST